MPNPNSPRYLPTLTEVVKPQDLESTPAPAPPAPSPALPDPGVLTQQLLQTLGPLLEQQLRAAAHDLLETHIRTAQATLHRHLEATVRKALADTRTR